MARDHHGRSGLFVLEMPPIGWAAEHRRHHQFSDEENDPHSPWRFGTAKRALTKGFVYSTWAGFSTKGGPTRALRRTYSRTRLWSGSTNTTATSQRRLLAAYSHRWVVVLELARCRYRLLLGRTGARVARAPCDVLDQLDLRHGGGPTRSTRATRLPTSGPWPSSASASRGTTHHRDPSCARHGVLKDRSTSPRD